MSEKHTIRTTDGGTIDVMLTRNQAIKAMCTECGGYGEMHPKDCPDKHCPLWIYRGKITLAYKSGDADVSPTEEKDD